MMSPIAWATVFDRGPRGYDIFKEILDDKRFTIIKGNHEDMFATGVYLGVTRDHISFKELRDQLFDSIWFFNGGDYTYENMKHLSDEEIFELAKKIMDMPTHLTIVNKDGKKLELSHSGFDPGYTDEYYEEYINMRYKKIKDSRYLWDRKHVNNVWTGDDNTYIIHGHTPVQKINSDLASKKEPEILVYCDNHKIDLDLCSAVTGVAAVFDLDTFEVQYVKAPVEGMFAQ